MNIDTIYNAKKQTQYSDVHIFQTLGTTGGFKDSSGAVYINDTGFCLPVYNANTVYNWIAFE
jgi:hypothetical protein